MAKRNYSDLIKCPIDRTLTAKGYKFVEECLTILASHHGAHRYSGGAFSPLKNKFTSLVKILIIDKGMTREGVIAAIKQRIVSNSIN